jgi:hypothetical protein
VTIVPRFRTTRPQMPVTFTAVDLLRVAPGQRLLEDVGVEMLPRDGLLGGLRRFLPIGWALGSLAPRFLRPIPPERIHFEDWTGVAVVLVFEK